MKTIVRSFLLNGILLLAMSAQGSTNEVMQNTEQDADQKIFSMYLNIPNRCIRLGEEAPIVLTIVNHTDEPLYIFDYENFVPCVSSVNREDLMRMLEENRSIPSINEFMNISGDLVHMQKVVEIPPMSGRVFMSNDFLKQYKDKIEPGHYYLYFDMDSLDYFQKSQVVIWGDKSLRVSANEIRHTTEVTVDIVTFEVIGGDVAEKEKDSVP